MQIEPPVYIQHGFCVSGDCDLSRDEEAAVIITSIAVTEVTECSEDAVSFSWEIEEARCEKCGGDLGKHANDLKEAFEEDYGDLVDLLRDEAIEDFMDEQRLMDDMESYYQSTR